MGTPSWNLFDKGRPRVSNLIMTRNNSDADATNNMKGEQLPLHLFLLLLLLLEKSLRTLLDKQNSFKFIKFSIIFYLITFSLNILY